MPKVETGNDDDTSLSLNAQADIKKYSTALLVNDKGLKLKKLEISFSTAESKEKSMRGTLIAGLLKRTPNITELKLNFSGHLHSYEDCLGGPLVDALCALKELEVFEHHRTTSARTDFGLYTLMKLVSSWPALRVLYLAGDTNGSGDYASLPAATCALEHATFERCLANFETFAPMFAGSTNSLRTLEAWTLGSKEIDAILLPVLPAIESIKVSGGSLPTPGFIAEHLARAPRLESVDIGGDESDGAIRKAFATALAEPGTFPALRWLGYPARSGTYNTGRGRNARKHEYENEGEEEVRKAAGERNIRAGRALVLEYKVEGAQRRAGFAAVARRGW